MTYVLLTMAIAYSFAEGPAVLSIILAWFLFTFYFIPPEGSIRVEGVKGWAQQTALLMGVIVAGLAMIQARKSMRRIQRLADESDRLNVSLQEQTRLLDLAHDAIMVRGAQDTITFWSRGAEETYGWTREEAMGQVAHELLKTLFPKPLTELSADLATNGRWEGELIHIRKDGGEIVVASRWAVQRDETGRQIGVLEINRDITERKRADEEIRKLNTELEKRVDERTSELRASNKELETAYNEMQTLSYSIMHDLRTPLRALGGFSDALLRHYPNSLDEKGRDYLFRIRSAANRIASLSTTSTTS